MEENQMPKKRNYERYLEAQEAEKSGEWSQESAYQEPVYEEPVYEEPDRQQSDLASSYASSYGQPVTPQRYDGLEEPVTKGEWAISFFLMMIPCVGFIMMFVWAFGKTEKKSKSNFFKVQLIFMGVIFVLYLLLAVLALVMGVALG